MHRRFVVGVDRAKMRLYDVEDTAQDIMDGPTSNNDLPLFDSTPAGKAFDNKDFKSLFT